jgi:hypothetical protein
VSLTTNQGTSSTSSVPLLTNHKSSLLLGLGRQKRKMKKIVARTTLVLFLVMTSSCTSAFQQLRFSVSTVVSNRKTTLMTPPQTSLKMEDSPPFGEAEFNNQQLNVPYGEVSRRFRRTIYSHDDWCVARKQSNNQT